MNVGRPDSRYILPPESKKNREACMSTAFQVSHHTFQHFGPPNPLVRELWLYTGTAGYLEAQTSAANSQDKVIERQGQRGPK